MAKKPSKTTSPIASAIEQGALIPDSTPSLPAELPAEALPAIVEAADEAAESLPVEVAVLPASEPEVPEPAIADAEIAYGTEKLNDLLKDKELFFEEGRAGFEPAVLDRMFHLLSVGGNSQRRPSARATNIPFLARSICKDPVKTVWEIAAGMPGAERKDVISACVRAGVATSTAHTQFQAWRSAGKRSVTGAPIVK